MSHKISKQLYVTASGSAWQLNAFDRNLAVFSSCSAECVLWSFLSFRRDCSATNKLDLRFYMQVKNTPDDHVTRDYREGRGKLGDLWFKAVDTSGDLKMFLLSLLSLCLQSSRNRVHNTHEDSEFTFVVIHSFNQVTDPFNDKAHQLFDALGTMIVLCLGTASKIYQLGIMRSRSWFGREGFWPKKLKSMSCNLGLEPYGGEQSIHTRATQLTLSVLQKADLALLLLDARYYLILKTSFTLMCFPCLVTWDFGGIAYLTWIVVMIVHTKDTGWNMLTLALHKRF